ncbi:MAG: HesA/MoeB/ThiF family protein [Spirochaetia bacterium]|nr:HesA/MoeB/ThiF family protein [Spirochaetia bacterium]
MLSKNEIERYSRQILSIGKESQNILKKSRVLVLGAGGIGSGLLPYLAASGVGFIRLLEPDIVEPSNLSRQILYAADNIGALKGATAVEFLSRLNPELDMEWLPVGFDANNHAPIIKDVDLILDGTDDIHCKFLLSDIAVKNAIPAIIGSIGNFQGHIFPVAGKPGFACYRCLFEKVPDEEIPTCATEGILSPLPGIIGSMMAYLSLQFLITRGFEKRIYLMEKGGWRHIAMNWNPHCSFCGRF